MRHEGEEYPLKQGEDRFNVSEKCMGKGAKSPQRHSTEYDQKAQSSQRKHKDQSLRSHPNQMDQSAQYQRHQMGPTFQNQGLQQQHNNEEPAVYSPSSEQILSSAEFH